MGVQASRIKGTTSNLQGMLEIKSFLFGLFGTNTYVVRNEKSEAIIIDPACSNPYEQEALLRYIQTENLTVKAIIATHGHLDHLWGATWACEQWHLPVLMHAADRQMAEAMQDQYNLFGVQRTAEPFPIASLRAAEKSFRLGFEIIETPGHTPGSVCLYWPKEKVLISGDTLFHMGYGRTDLPGGDIGQLIDSLGRLFTLPPDVRVYPGHGDSTTIGAEAR